MAPRILAPFAFAASLLAACTSPDASTGPPRTEPPRALEVEGRIVLAGDDGEIHVLSIRTGRSHAVTSIPGDQFDSDGYGHMVVFRDSRSGVNVDDEIYVVGSDGTHVRNLTNAPDSNEWGPAWSPDGTRIAFNSDRDGMPQVYVMGADGSGLRRLSDVEGEYPTWSPDGTRIAFASYVGGSTPFGDPDYDVFVMDASGSNEANVTNDPESYDMYPTWSPDGEWIAFESTRATPATFEPPSYDPERISDFDIWVMRPDGTDLRNVTANLETLEKFPDWSSEGIVYSREGAIVVVSPDGSAELDVSERTGLFGHFPAWMT